MVALAGNDAGIVVMASLIDFAIDTFLPMNCETGFLPGGRTRLFSTRLQWSAFRVERQSTTLGRTIGTRVSRRAGPLRRVAWLSFWG